MVINTGFYKKFCEIDVATCKSKLLADFTNIQHMQVHLNIAFQKKTLVMANQLQLKPDSSVQNKFLEAQAISV